MPKGNNLLDMEINKLSIKSIIDNMRVGKFMVLLLAITPPDNGKIKNSLNFRCLIVTSGKWYWKRFLLENNNCGIAQLPDQGSEGSLQMAFGENTLTL